VWVEGHNALEAKTRLSPQVKRIRYYLLSLSLSRSGWKSDKTNDAGGRRAPGREGIREGFSGGDGGKGSARQALTKREVLRETRTLT